MRVSTRFTVPDGGHVGRTSPTETVTSRMRDAMGPPSGRTSDDDVGLALMDDSGVVQGADPAFGGHLGAVDVVGHPLTDLVHADHRDALAAVLAAMRAGHLPRARLAARPARGDERWIELTFVPERLLGRAGNDVVVTASALDATRVAGIASSARAVRDATLLERTSDAICVIDTSGRITFANAAVRAFLGVEPGAVVGTRALSWVHPDDRGPLRLALRAWFRGATGEASLDVRLRHRDRRWRDAEARLDSAVDDPVIRGVIVVFRDITERLLSQRRRVAVLETVASLTRATTLAEAFEAFDRAACEVAWHDLAVFAVRQGIDYRIVSAIGVDIPIGATVPGTDRLVALLERAGRLVAGALPSIDSGVAKRLANSGVRAMAAHAMRAGGEVIGFLALGAYDEHAFDEADLVLLEAMTLHGVSALRTLRALEIEQANAAAFSEFAEVRKLFLEMAAHDLRTPLSVIRGLSETLAERWDDLPEPTKRHFVERVSHNADTLTTMLRRMLETTEVASPALELRREAVDLASVARSVTDDLELTSGREIKLTGSGSPVVRADRMRLEEVMANLVQNALAYSPPSQPVEIRLQDAGGAAIVSVHDHGPGIPDDKREVIFRRLTRLADTDDAGFGLGLYLCRLIVEAHGGRIWVDSDSEGGSTFSFTIPVESRSAAVEMFDWDSAPAAGNGA